MQYDQYPQPTPENPEPSPLSRPKAPTPDGGLPPQAPTPREPESGTPREFAKGVFSVILEFVITVVIIFAVSFVIRMFVLQPFVVEGQSMEPNFHNQEYLLAEKITKYFTDYKRGDVIIFKSPSEDINLIKRIIGLPGEKVVVEDGKISIYKNPYSPKATLVEEDYILPDESQNQEPIEVTLEKNQYFVFGDNRTNSVDSRSFGPISKDNIIGKVWLTAFPITNLQLFKTPEYNKSLSFLPLNLYFCT